jgi:hypothetical protein
LRHARRVGKIRRGLGDFAVATAGGRCAVIGKCRLCLGLLALMGSLGVVAQDLATRAAPPTARDYPEANGVFLFSHKQFWWGDDGRLVEDFHHFYTIFTARGLDKIRDFRLTFRPADQRIGVIRAGTYGPDGAFAAAATEASEADFLPADGCRSGQDARLWQRRVSLPAGVGGSAEVRLQRLTNGLTRGFSGVEYLQTDDPLMERRIYFYLPVSAPFHHEVVNDVSVLSLVSRQDDREVYAFRFGELPAIPLEPAMPPPEWLAARLVYSVYADWDEAAREFRESYWRQVQTAPRTSARVRELCTGLTDRSEVLQRLAGFVQRSIRTDDISLWAAGRRPLPPDEVLAAGCGDPKDKAMLLGAMLAAAGVPAVPVLIQRSLVPLLPDVPAVEQFNGLCLLIPAGEGGPLYLDPVDPWAPPGWIPQSPGARCLVVREQACALETLPAMVNTTEMNVTVRLAENGDAAVTVHGVLRGFAARQARQRLAGMDDGAVDGILQAAAGRWFATLRDHRAEFDGTQPGGLDIHFNQEFGVTAAASVQSGVMVFMIPALGNPFNELLPRWPGNSRQTPVFLGPPAEERIVFEIRLPSGREVLYTPPDGQVEKDSVSLSRQCTVDADRATIRLEWITRTRDVSIPAADSMVVRRQVADFQDPAHRLLVLRPQDASPSAPSSHGKEQTR